MDQITSLSKKQLIGIIVLLFLLITIPLSIYLVRQTQIFKPKAVGEASTVEVLNENNELVPQNNNIYEPTSQRVKFKLQYRQ